MTTTQGANADPVVDDGSTVVRINSVPELIEKAGFIRKQLALGTHRIGGVHIGGPLSATDMAVALYYKHLGFDPANLDDPYRNTFILSKGHNGILLYTIFCDLGLYDWDELLDTYNTVEGNTFGAHPNRLHVKGIEVSTGSLGHGLSLACGVAHANRDKQIPARVYVMLGDGEMEEGSNWEAIMYAASKKLDGIVAIVDFNHFSASFAAGENIVWPNMAETFRSFGWDAIEVDGTDMQAIDEVLSSLPPVDYANPGKPIAIISSTTKGQGIDYMEAAPGAWHIGGLSKEKLEETYEIIDAYTARKLAEVK